MALGGRVYKQKTITGKIVSSAQSAAESNKCTPVTTICNKNSCINQTSILVIFRF